MWEDPWSLSADEDLDVRVDLRGDPEPRPNEGEELDGRGDLRGDAEPRPNEGEEPDVRGDAAENPNEAVAAAGPGEDVERRPVAVEKPSTGHDLCDDVTMAPAACDDFVTAIE